MTSDHESFWTNASFAFVGHSTRAAFPRISFGALQKQGRKVFAVDPSVAEIDGSPTYPDLHSLPEKVDAVVLELPREETLDWVLQAADAGIRNVWIHRGRDTPEASRLAEERGLHLLTGTCAVMYVKPGPSFHTIHRWVAKLTGKF
jgi:predicted CoA-binding protein